MKPLIELLHEYKKITADISYSLIEYANIYSTPGATGENDEKATSNVLRKLSSKLNAKMYLIA